MIIVAVNTDTPAQRWLRRVERLEPMSKGCFWLCLVVALGDFTLHGHFTVWGMTQIQAPLVWLGVGLGGLRILLGIPMVLWRKRELQRAWEEAHTKRYPEGCTCIRGALTDSRHCPHHGDRGGTL